MRSIEEEEESDVILANWLSTISAMLFVSPVALKHFSNLVYVSSYQNYKSNSCCSTSPQSAVRRHSVPRWCFCCLNSGEAASPTAKFSSQRAILSASLSDFEVDEVNKLLEMAGEKQRNPQRFQRALQNSLVVVTARLISNGILVGLTRAITDGAYNATIVEVFTDRRLPKPVSFCD